ncbi:hypothetical protein MUP77_15550 [Candidatus Bathyarchaeota archaeon]|nr:hypothetical protein [Candidatus Bathyarchaeota archaeon]
MMFNYTIKYFDLIYNPSKILALPNSSQQNVLKAMTALSKYLGIYDSYKEQLKRYGIKWSNKDTAFNSFLAIFNHKHDTLGAYIESIQPTLYNNEKLFLRFLTISGLRTSVAISSFNMIIELSKEGNLADYYNKENSTLQHFKYKQFRRITKNAFITICPNSLINEISQSQLVTYDAIRCKIHRKHLRMRLKELRSYHNSYLRKNGIISELVDILAGRVPSTVFARHYLGADMKTLAINTLPILEELEKSLIPQH